MSKQNFENLMFDVTKFGGKVSIQDAFPELLPYKEYSEISSIEWKVAILMTDIGSDFVKVRDPYQKIDSIFKSLNLDPKKHLELFSSALEFKSGNLLDACAFLLEYQNNHEFAAWFNMNNTYYEVLKAINKELPSIDNPDYDKALDRKASLQDRLSKMQETLKKYETNLFGTASMKAAAIFRSKKKKQIMNYNEKYAQSNQVE